MFGLNRPARAVALLRTGLLNFASFLHGLLNLYLPENELKKKI
jgi:hypothetical protein